MRARWRVLAATGAALAGAVLLIAQPAHAIVGGTVTQPSPQFPYFASFATIYGDGYFRSCGATVIASGWVLTAAHCLEPTSPSGAPVSQRGVGFFDPQDSSPALQIVVHPLWDGNPDDGHDLAVIRVDPLKTRFIPQIQVGSPWDASVFAAGAPVTMMGFGITAVGNLEDGKFRSAATVLAPDAGMSQLYDAFNPTLMLGAGTTTTTACSGDSGGPLVEYAGSRTIQLGVDSFGKGDDQECRSAAVFTRLSGPLLAWVAAQVPAAMNGWPSCSTLRGLRGQPAATYTRVKAPGAGVDSGNGLNYAWSIQCVPPNPGAATPTPTTPVALG